MDTIPIRKMFFILQKFDFLPSSLSLVSNWGGKKHFGGTSSPKASGQRRFYIFIVHNSIKGYGGNNDR